LCMRHRPNFLSITANRCKDATRANSIPGAENNFPAAGFC
jgi:hypothetical protein